MSVRRAPLLAIEEAAVRSWPALQRVPLDGWLWRCTSGGSVRANTVASSRFSGADVEAAIDEAERSVPGGRRASRFTISAVSAPADLDQRLEARGYRRGDDHVTMRKSVSAGAVPADAAALGAEPTPEWMAVYLAGLTEDRRGVAPRILAGLPRHRMYFACCAARPSGEQRPVDCRWSVCLGPVHGHTSECAAARRGACRAGRH